MSGTRLNRVLCLSVTQDIDWTALYTYQLKAPWVPEVQHAGDTSHFDKYPDSDVLADPVVMKDDPFKNF